MESADVLLVHSRGKTKQKKLLSQELLVFFLKLLYTNKLCYINKINVKTY